MSLSGGRRWKKCEGKVRLDREMAGNHVSISDIRRRERVSSLSPQYSPGPLSPDRPMKEIPGISSHGTQDCP